MDLVNETAKKVVDCTVVVLAKQTLLRPPRDWTLLLGNIGETIDPPLKNYGW